MFMKKIGINRSRLELVQLESVYSSSGNYFSLQLTKNEKHSLKIQYVVEIIYYDKRILKYKLRDIRGRRFITTRREDSEQKCEFWCIKQNSSEFNGEMYTFEELRIIYSFIDLMYRNRFIDITEALVHGTEDKQIISEFYKASSPNEILSYCGNLEKIVIDITSSDIETTPIACEQDIPKKCYNTYGKYSVEKLLTDLVNDDAEILVDPQLIGKYERISCGELPKDDNAEYQKENWYKITGILGNKRRANLSLTYSMDTKVGIPVNPYDIIPGVYTFKKKSAICIIKDSILHQKYLGVKVSKTLEKKLKRTKVLVGDLLGEGEFLIDFSKLPVVSKDWIREVSKSHLGKLEVQYILSKIILKYINFIWEKNREEKKSDKELFLESLGIYGEYYKGCKNEDDPYNEDIPTYPVIELTPRISAENVNIWEGYDETQYKLYHDLTKRSQTSRWLRELFDSINIDENCSKNLEEFKNKWISCRNSYGNEIRERVFDLIMSKTFYFTEGYIGRNNVRVKLIENKDFYVRVNWIFKSRDIKCKE